MFVGCFLFVVFVVVVVVVGFLVFWEEGGGGGGGAGDAATKTKKTQHNVGKSHFFVILRDARCVMCTAFFKDEGVATFTPQLHAASYCVAECRMRC